MKRTPLARKTRLRRKPWRRALGTPELRLSFKRRVHELDGGNCVMVGRSVCGGPLDAAHCIPKSRLRDLGYGADVVYDERAAFSLCRKHHERHDHYIERVPYSRVPERCRLFVQALGLHRLLQDTAA